MELWKQLRVENLKGDMSLHIRDKTLVTAMSIKMHAEIVSYGRGLIKGSLHNRYLETPFVFYSLLRMIDKMEEVFDEKKFPQAFLKPRTFEEARGKVGRNKSVKQIKAAKVVTEDVDQSLYEGPGNAKCTFDINVRYRQNASWQGHIFWVEKALNQNFRSVLEMIKLIDEAMCDTELNDESVAWE